MLGVSVGMIRLATTADDSVQRSGSYSARRELCRCPSLNPGNGSDYARGAPVEDLDRLDAITPEAKQLCVAEDGAVPRPPLVQHETLIIHDGCALQIIVLES